jgi:hypothetical protein
LTPIKEIPPLKNRPAASIHDGLLGAAIRPGPQPRTIEGSMRIRERHRGVRRSEFPGCADFLVSDSLLAAVMAALAGGRSTSHVGGEAIGHLSDSVRSYDNDSGGAIPYRSSRGRRFAAERPTRRRHPRHSSPMSQLTLSRNFVGWAKRIDYSRFTPR